MRRRMGRPCLRRRISGRPKTDFFKPQGIPMRHLNIVELTREEVEAMRLKNIKDLSQNDCAEIMKTSQSTFQRILASAYRKMSQAIVEGKAIRIIK